jgi:hypothetical protein
MRQKKQDFSLVQIGYNRNEERLAAKAETCEDRKAFVEWAVNYIRSNSKVTRDELFVAWSACGPHSCAKTFFTAAFGTPLSMRELKTRAFPEAPAAAGGGGRRGTLRL